MDNFFKKFSGGDKDKKKNDGKQQQQPGIKNPFANLGGALSGIGGTKKFSGEGHTLGGSHRMGEIIPICLSESGPLGMKVEKSTQQKAIVSDVIENSQASRAGLRRGDIICFPHSNGAEEMLFDQFMAIAKSDRRPFKFDIRRVATTAGAGMVGRGGPNHNNRIPNKRSSAEDYAKKQAMMRALDAREKAHKKKTAPSNNSLSNKNEKSNNGRTLKSKKEILMEQEEQAKRLQELQNQGPQSYATHAAVQAAKQDEIKSAQQLGFNLYETAKMTGDKARNTVVDVQHGSIGGGNDSNSGGPPSRATPVAPTSTNNSNNSVARTKPKKLIASIDESFDTAFFTLKSISQNPDTNNNIDVKKSTTTIHKLVTNATTKGRSEEVEDNSKFLRVRLSNKKIKEVIVDVPGALDMMMSFGFILLEEGDEMFLVYNAHESDKVWLKDGLEKLKNFELY